MPREQQQRFQEWKENQVTKDFMQAVGQRIEGAKEHLVPSTNSHEYDLFMKGVIHAYREVLDVKLENLLEETEQDEV